MAAIRGVALADLHVGSRVGLANPKETPASDAGAPVRAGLFRCWEESVSGPHAKPDVLLVVGDCVEGGNRKQSGIGTWTTDLLEQADHAVELLRMWHADRIFMIRGSGYHVEANNSGLQIEEYIARQLGAEEYPNQEHLKPARRDRSGWSWYLRLAGVNMHISHKISVSKVFHYQSTPTARQLLNARLNNGLRRVLSKDEDSKLRVVIRAHAHYYNTVGYSGSDGYVLPCWKALDEWMLAGGPIEISPDIGYLGFHCEDGVWSYDKRLFHLEDVQPPPYTVIKPRNGNGRSRARSRAKASG